jgi:hypothetical protein
MRNRSSGGSGRLSTVLACLLVLAPVAGAQQEAAVPEGYELVYEQGFDGMRACGDFLFSDPLAWRRARDVDNSYLELFKPPEYQPPHRSPQGIAVIAPFKVGDFVLEADLHLTGSTDDLERDMCVFFGIQDPTHYYYCHLAGARDEFHQVVHIVNDAPRTKISDWSSEGTKWASKPWHKVRVERELATGAIRVFVDGERAMTATDKTFGVGYLGLGSFNDTGRIDNIRVWAPKQEKVAAAFFRPLGISAAKKERAPDVTGPGFEPLFDSKTLDGWRRVNGSAEYHVDDGCIVGVCDPKARVNTFLRTERTFRDFIFTAEVKFDVIGNSGIQFRSNQRDGNGRVFGYQCEIDPSPDRRWSGGIYDEARRGWLHPLEGDEYAKERQAFDFKGWNTFIIKAQGRRLQTWVNGVPCSDYVDLDDLHFTPEGFIALQVHAGEQGTIRFRNIRIKVLPGAQTDADKP